MRVRFFTGVALASLVAISSLTVPMVSCTSLVINASPTADNQDGNTLLTQLDSDVMTSLAAQTDADEIIGAPEKHKNSLKRTKSGQENKGKGDDALPKNAIRELLRRTKRKQKKRKEQKQCKKCSGGSKKEEAENDACWE